MLRTPPPARCLWDAAIQCAGEVGIKNCINLSIYDFYIPPRVHIHPPGLRHGVLMDGMASNAS